MLYVIAVLDGRPGHEKQTLGVVAGLRARTEVMLTSINISHGILNRFRYGLQLLLPFLAPLKKKLQDADLVIGTGSRTHSLVLMLKKKYGIPACTCMSPSLFMRRQFDYCFVPEHDKISPARNIFFTLGAPNPCFDRGLHQKDQGLILLGGIDKNSHDWDCDEISEQVLAIIESDQGRFWTISSSPRTPLTTVDKIRKQINAGKNARFFEYSQTPPGWIEEQYDRCGMVWVTSDSISMLYEALSSGCQVNIFPMKWLRKNCKFRENEQLLLRKGIVSSYSAWFKQHQSGCCKSKLNEAQRCADKILETWWPKSLL